jgi:sugar phosphate isomerase/epimerase
MKLGIDNYSYHRFFGEVYPGQPEPGVTWDLSDCVDHILSLEYLDLIECLSLETCFITEDENTVVKQLQRLGKPVFFAWGHPNGFMEVNLEEAREQVGRYLNLSKLFSADRIRIAGSSINYYHEPHQPQIQRVKSYLERLIPLAEQQGIRLAIENHGDFSLFELQEIIDHFSTPYLGLTLDTGNCLRLGEDPLEAVDALGTKVSIVHAKDVGAMDGFSDTGPRRFGCVPAGEGMADFPSLFERLHSVGFNGPVLLELSGLHPAVERLGEPEILRRGLRFLHRVRGLREALDA